MALPIPRGAGFTSMLKEGSKYFSGLDEAVLRNIDACCELAKTLKSAYGPRGLNKMIINHLERLFVTSDAATIIRELEVQHPAAKMMVLASQMQEQEVGDATNFTILLIGALLERAEELIRMGLKPAEIVEGYELAADKVLDEILPKLVLDEVKDVRNLDQVTRALKSAIMSKHLGSEDILAPLAVKACLAVLPEDPQSSAFNVDNVRVCKILGAGVQQSEVVLGMVFKRLVEGDITKATDAKIAVYTCPIDASAPETKGTVLIKNAQELMDFSRGEESILEQQIKSISDAGVKVLVSGGKMGDLALHYMNKYGLMAVRLQSKFDLRRLCKAVGAIALPKIVPPKPEEIGHCDHVYVDEVGETRVIIFRQEKASASKIATVLVRGSTDNLMDDIERAVDDAVNTFKVLTKDGRLVGGAGAAEAEIAKQIQEFGEQLPGIEQYAVTKFGEALLALPEAIAENAGIKTNELMVRFVAAHQEGQANAGINIESESSTSSTPDFIDVASAQILDLFAAKRWGIKYATNTACQILLVDQIICAKPAGGAPKPKENKHWDDD